MDDANRYIYILKDGIELFSETTNCTLSEIQSYYRAAMFDEFELEMTFSFHSHRVFINHNWGISIVYISLGNPFMIVLISICRRTTNKHKRTLYCPKLVVDIMETIRSNKFMSKDNAISIG